MTEEEDYNIGNFSLYAPQKGSSLFTDYPELRKHNEFRELNDREMLFVWYFACKTSPYRMNLKDEHAMARFSYRRAYKGIENPVDESKFDALKFSPKISEAVEVMKRFNPGARLHAKQIQDKVMENYWKIVNIDVNDEKEFRNKDGEVDWTKKKAYVDSASKIVSDLPSLVEQVESSFGMKEKNLGEKDEFEGTSLMDQYVAAKS